MHKANDLLQVASHDPNVNLYFLKHYQEKICFNNLPGLLDMCGIHTIWKIWKMQKKQVNGILEKLLSLCLKFLWTLLREGKPLKKSMSLIFIHYHIVVIDGARNIEIECCWNMVRSNTIVKHLTKLPKAKQPTKREGQFF